MTKFLFIILCILWPRSQHTVNTTIEVRLLPSPQEDTQQRNQKSAFGLRFFIFILVSCGLMFGYQYLPITRTDSTNLIAGSFFVLGFVLFLLRLVPYAQTGAHYIFVAFSYYSIAALTFATLLESFKGEFYLNNFSSIEIGIAAVGAIAQFAALGIASRCVALAIEYWQKELFKG